MSWALETNELIMDKITGVRKGYINQLSHKWCSGAFAPPAPAPQAELA